MLSASIVLWSIASLLSAFAGSYSTLLLTRLLLGLVVATAGPAIASLTGDYFPAKERGKIYAYILGGEIAGSAFGFIICGSVASAISWRAAFVLLAIPGFFLARELYRTVPEPLRGGQSHLEPGVEDLVEAAARARARPQPSDDWLEPDERPTQVEDLAQPGGTAARCSSPIPSWCCTRTRGRSRSWTRFATCCDPDERPDDHQLVARLLLLLGSADVRAAVRRGHYHVGQPTSELVLALLVVGAMVGTLISGWLADELRAPRHT